MFAGYRFELKNKNGKITVYWRDGSTYQAPVKNMELKNGEGVKNKNGLDAEQICLAILNGEDLTPFESNNEQQPDA